MKKYIYILIAVLNIIACDDYLDVENVGQVIPKTVEDFRSFLTSAYDISKNHKILTTYRADELFLEDNALGVEQYRDIYIWNDDNKAPETTPFAYATFYNTIFYTNHIINSENEIEGNESEKNQIIGEAYALRALQYFELVNLYATPYNPLTANTDAGVPVTTEYDSEKAYPKKSVAEVYSLILSDLDQATNYLNINEQTLGYNYRFSILAVKAFKSRVYLYQQEWQKAIDVAREALAINNQLQNLNTDVSIMPSEYNSVESILALETVADFDLVNRADISDDLIAAYNQTEDLRFPLYFHQNTDGTFQSNKNAENKFKVSFRVAELYLNIAESYAQLNELNLAKEQLISFTENRYTPVGWEAYKTNLSTLNKEDLLEEILQERRRELAIEGHRWNDLRRTNQPNITKIFDGTTYTLQQNDEKYVIPFPNDAIINNPDL